MRVVRVHYNNTTFFGAIEEKSVRCLNAELGLADPIPFEELLFLPLVTPSKIICVGVNYKEHAAEMGRQLPEDPLLFMKPPSAVIGNGQNIVLPSMSEEVNYEGELALVMGRECRNLPPDEVAPCIFGYTCANDVTARDLQRKDVQFTRAKGFDTFAPIGPWIETQVPEPANLAIRTTVNGEVKQEGHTSDMIFDPFEIVSAVSKVMTLLPGDVILTGTPSGVGALKPGDEVRVEIETVGLLINKVVAEEAEQDTPTQ